MPLMPRGLSRFACLLLAMALLPFASASGQSYSQIYAFQGGSDGALPFAGLTPDKTGNLYGTTLDGGAGTCNLGAAGCGTLFMVTPGGQETVLYAFTGGTDGAYPYAPLRRSAEGNLYGTAAGRDDQLCSGNKECGTIFEYAANGAFNVLHSFLGGSDGMDPQGPLLNGRRNYYFGVTVEGGNTGCMSSLGCGTVYKLTRLGKAKESVIYTFSGASTGENPSGSLAADTAGTLYGTTSYGGDRNCGADGCGTVFALAADGTETVLHVFEFNDGIYPASGLVEDHAGNLYGTAPFGGETCQNDTGCGTIFKITANGTFSVLHIFGGGSDGGNPHDAPLIDSKGNLYGTAAIGGGNGSGCGGDGCGTVFKLAPDGTFTALYTFTGGNDGWGPIGALVEGGDGYLYGTTVYGGGSGCSGFGCGTVFRVKK
jgi:uncharacterized repeat protein (TIGR03803 family)